MADVTQLKLLVDSYGVAVRAGVMTPCTEDEMYIRSIMGFPEMPDSVKKDWAKSDGIRHPITTRSGLGQKHEVEVDESDESEEPEATTDED